MKDYKVIAKEIKKNNEKIATLEADANKLLKTDEKTFAKSFEERKKIFDSVTEADEQKAVAILSEVKELKNINVILEDNLYASFSEYAAEKIKEILTPYANKNIGEKTREKIRAAAKQYGFSFYRNYSGSFEASTLNNEGYLDYVIRSAHLHTTDNAGHYTEIYNKEGKLNDFSNIKVTHNYKYTEKPKQKVKQIEKAMKELEKALKKASELQAEVNKILPSGKRIDKVETLRSYDYEL